MNYTHCNYKSSREKDINEIVTIIYNIFFTYVITVQYTLSKKDTTQNLYFFLILTIPQLYLLDQQNPLCRLSIAGPFNFPGWWNFDVFICFNV